MSDPNLSSTITLKPEPRLAANKLRNNMDASEHKSRGGSTPLCIKTPEPSIQS